MRYALTWVTLLCMLAPAAPCAEEAGRDEVPVTRLKLQPAPEPVPALKYRLLPGVLEMEPGNAATLYNWAVAKITGGQNGNTKELLELLEMPIEDLTIARVRAARAPHGRGPLFRLLERAGRREDCDWDLELSVGPALDLPSITDQRKLATIAVLTARMEIVWGNCEEAVQMLQTPLAMARHMAQGAALIHGLVGMQVARLALDRVEDLAQAPGSPNLYWALTALPRPLIDMRDPVETERHMFDLWLPDLRDPESSRLGPEGWREMIEQFPSLGGGSGPLRRKLTPSLVALWMYTDAKNHLIERGRDPDQVEAMPVFQMVAIYVMDGWNRVMDDQFKWFYVPYAEGEEVIAEAQASFTETLDQKNDILPAMLMPALYGTYSQMAGLDRQVAALRCIEAVRLYAALHDGELPASLSEIKEVPVPLNPMTGESFQYEVVGETATLSAPLGPHERAKDGIRYELTIAK